MLVKESVRIKELLDEMEGGSINPVLNVGSSTLEFRDKVQPWINGNIFSPLEKRGIKVLHTDLKEGDGIDLIGDLTNVEFQNKLKEHKFNLVICANLLEHVNIRNEICELLEDVVHEQGYILLTVPYSYPYHPDPIDTMYRPTPSELFDNFKKSEVVASEIINCGNYLDRLLADPLYALKTIVRLLLPVYKPTSWWRQLCMMAWIFKQYKVTLLILRKAE